MPDDGPSNGGHPEWTQAQSSYSASKLNQMKSRTGQGNKNRIFNQRKTELIKVDQARPKLEYGPSKNNRPDQLNLSIQFNG